MTEIAFENQLCESCKYHFGYSCHRYAPKPMIWHSTSGDGFGESPVSLWPDVDSDDWCGEWKARQ